MLIAFFTMAIGQAQHVAFLQNMSAYCGRSFGGTAVFPEGDKNPFAGKALIVHFAGCSDSELRMPFWVGEDKSRTWVLTLEPNGRLLFKHDHRHEDGTPDEVTNYGGYANTSGDAWRQYFPADDFTAKLIPAAATNEWAFVIDNEASTLDYVLKRNGELRFSARFDLSAPLD